MLRDIHLSSFKCFDALNLPLAPLTLLSGANGTGKSTVIQALVLLSHTLSRREWGRRLQLEGEELALGSVADIVNQASPRRSVSMGAATEDQRAKWTFKAGDRKSLSLELESITLDGESFAPGEAVRWLLPVERAESSSVVLALRRLCWISAERTGPRELLPLHDEDGHTCVGCRGELAAGLLYWRGEEKVTAGLQVPGVPPTLFHQVRARMQEFFPGCDIRVSPIDGASAVSLALRSDIKTEFQRPQNVGFGLTQLFPIIVALLAAGEGDLLLIENPEVHLHPKAQQDAGTLLALGAVNGVQVIVETHSDHVLNGMRLAVKAGKIPAKDVAVHFFKSLEGGNASQPLSPTIDNDGRLSQWPDGFFDQFDIALAKLL